MSIYIYNICVLVVLFFLCNLSILKKSYIYLCVIYFLLIFGQRWYAGVDFYGYFKYYLLGFRTEVGYYLIQEFLYKHNIYFGIFIFIIYTFTTLVSLWFLRKFIYTNLSILIFFISEYHIMSLNPLRTYIAINIFLIGIYFYSLKNKKIIGFLIMFSGIFFHMLTIGAMIVYFSCKNINIFKIKKTLNWLLFILPLINFKPFLYYMTYIFLPKYISYFGSEYDKELSFLNKVRYYIILLLFIYFQKYILLNNRKEKILLQGIYIFLLLMGMATYFGELHRIAYFFKIFELIFFLYILEYKKIKKTLKLLIITIFILNYIGIIYKDMGSLWYYKLRPLHLYNKFSKEEYIKELNDFYEIRKKYISGE